jgi:ComEC/Rec2-related protein
MWWAAFIVLGIVLPPGVSDAAVVTACTALCLLVSLSRFIVPECRTIPGSTNTRTSAVRAAVLAATVLLLWTGAATERGRYDGKRAPLGHGVGPVTESAHAPSSHSAGIGDVPDERNAPEIPSSFERLSAYLVQALEHPRLSPLCRGMMKALLLARRSDLPWKVRDTFEYLGIAHFLALSGLHLGIIAVPVASLLGLVRLGQRCRNCFLMGILFLYVATVGFPPSLVRALSLTCAFFVFRGLGLKTGLVPPLVLGGIIVVAFSFETVMRTGYQLSFAAVCGIALVGLPLVNAVGPRLPRKRPFAVVRFVLYPSLVTVSIQLFALPLVLSMFKRSSLLAPVANLLMLIPVSVFLYTGCVYFLLPCELLRTALAAVLNRLSSALCDLPALLSHGPHPAIYRGDIEPLVYAAGVAVLSLGLAKRCRKRTLLLCFSILLVIVSVLFGRLRNPCRPIAEHTVCSMDIGRGCILLAYPPGILYIERDTSGYGGRTVVRKLWNLGMRRIDVLVIGEDGGTWGGSIRYILERIEVGEIVCTPYFGANRRDVVQAARNLGIPVHFASRGDSILYEKVAIEIIEPRYPPRGGEVISRDEARLCCRIKRRKPGGTGMNGSIVLPRDTAERQNGTKR